MDSPDRKIVFNFNDSDKEVDKETNDKGSDSYTYDLKGKGSSKEDRKNSNKDKDKDNRSEGEKSLSHIKNIDVYDRLNFKRLQVKRNSRKGKTSKCPKMNFTIEKFTDEITKITEDLQYVNMRTDNLSNVNENGRSGNKKKTIRFAAKKVTYQYPKEKEIISLTGPQGEKLRSLFSDKEEDNENDEETPTSNFNFVEENESNDGK